RPVWDRADTTEPVYSADEVATWPAGVLDQLLTMGLLGAANNANALVCDACGDGHVEAVTYGKSPAGSGLRAYLRCPAAGRVCGPLERLRRWEVNFRTLAALTARLLEAAGGLEEIRPSRLWWLGKTTLAGWPCEIFLARGLTWRDAAELIGGASR